MGEVLSRAGRLDRLSKARPDPRKLVGWTALAHLLFRQGPEFNTNTTQRDSFPQSTQHRLTGGLHRTAKSLQHTSVAERLYDRHQATHVHSPEATRLHCGELHLRLHQCLERDGRASSCI